VDQDDEIEDEEVEVLTDDEIEDEEVEKEEREDKKSSFKIKNKL
jgi:hypothetical protein